VVNAFYPPRQNCALHKMDGKWQRYFSTKLIFLLIKFFFQGHGWRGGKTNGDEISANDRTPEAVSLVS